MPLCSIPLAAAVVEVQNGHAAESGFPAVFCDHAMPEIHIGQLKMVHFVVWKLFEAFLPDNLTKTYRHTFGFTQPELTGGVEEFLP